MSKFGVEYEYPKLKFHVPLEHLGYFLLRFIGHMSVYIHRGLNMVYERMKEVSHIVGLDLLDYLIVTHKSEYRSLREIGDLERRTILNK
ncbi:hypothetical protein MKX83_00890 [Cytobacillus sp. FSL M8-0252]|uniref:hypothetical protein n=1 Tax=Cytobacillus sp. FSL M8-0252 TaxID=2921621 RepID=UPI0030F7B7AA